MSLLNHLWQSTLFALAVGLAAAALRRQSAGLRHGLWLAASAKFLIPFAILQAIGARLAPAVPPALIRAPLEPRLLQGAVEPFPESPVSTPPTAAGHVPLAIDPGPILLGVWALGSAVVLCIWLCRWLKVRRIIGSSVPVDRPALAPIRCSASLLEPVLAGIWRPVLLIPEGLFDHLQPSQIEAVLAHETCHLRRRDNLTASAHMLVEALFWFYPPVWWIGGRLLVERERACDEAVIRAGHDREVYARGIVEVCRLYVRSPLASMAGAAGSKLEQRLEDIMTSPPAFPLPLALKALLGAAGVGAFASPLALGLLTAPAEPSRPTVATQGRTAAAVTSAMIASLSPEDLDRRRLEQLRPRRVVPFVPAHFDRYIGYYELGPDAALTVFRVGEEFFVKRTGQGPLEVFPESEAKFFATAIAAQFSFTGDDQGKATSLVLHQDGRERLAPRISEAKARAFAEEVERRVAGNVPSPGTQAFLRRYLESEEAGSPDYSGMEPELAQSARAQQQWFANKVRTWGALQSIRFNGATAQGADTYTVTFRNARAPFVVAPLDENGKVSGLSFTPPAASPSVGPETVRRIRDNRPGPGAEAAVRKWLAALEAGRPNYEDMAPSLADIARLQWPRDSRRIKAFGPLKRVRFVRVTPQGRDVYEADFQNNRIEVTIGPLDADGKVSDRSWQFLP